MQKRQLIDEIREFNTSATIEFLSKFDDNDLRQYLDHLKAARDKRLYISKSVRPGDRLRLVS